VPFREESSVDHESSTEYIDMLCGQKVEFLNGILGGMYDYHWALNGAH
jgi:hypothetical protein